MAKQNKEKEDEQARFGTYLKDYQDAYKYVRDNYHDKWFQCYSVYSNRRVKIGYNGIADAFVPETRTIVESLVANIAGGTPRFQYIPTTEEQSADTEVLTELVDYYWDCNHMSVKAQSWVRDAIIYGTGILHVTWDAHYNRPQIDNVALRDFIIDPTATTLENARYAGFRYLADLENLKQQAVIDPQTGETTPKYKNLNNLQTGSISGASKDEMDKQKKEQLLGSTLGTDNERQVEVILIYYADGKLVELGNRSQVIREVDTPFQLSERHRDVEVMIGEIPQMVNKKLDKIDPFMPFAILRSTIDSSLFYGVGDVEVIMDRQETLNDVETLDLDNLHYLNNVMWRIDPAYEDLAPDIESSPGIVIPVPRNALEPLEKPAITNDLDAKKAEIKDEMRRLTAADEIMQGAAPLGSRTTATEISAVQNNARARFKTKVTNLESEGFAQLGSVLFKLAQIFLDQKTVVRIVGPEGVAFKDFDPFEYSGYYEPHVRLESTVKEQQLEQGQKLNQMYQLILNNPVVDQREAVRFIMKNLGADEDELKKLLAPQMAPQTPGLSQMQNGMMNDVMPDGGPMMSPEVEGAMQAQQDMALQQAGGNNEPGQSEA